VAAEENGATLLTVSGGFTVTGPLETFANAGGVHLAHALLVEFSANMAKLIQERRAAAPAAETPAPEPGVTAPDATAPPSPLPPSAAPEISAIRLLWHAFRSWLRSLFSIKGER
jgi:uncharacterized protein